MTRKSFFVYSSILILKSVLKHTGNGHSSVPVAHAAHMKETYNNTSITASRPTIEISAEICKSLLCYWDSSPAIQSTVVSFVNGTAVPKKRVTLLDAELATPKKISSRTEKNEAHEPLVDPAKIHLPSLHMKLGLMKNFVVKSMNKKAKLSVT